MALVIADRVKETSGSTGTDNLGLVGASVGFQRFADAIGDGNTTYYAVSLADGSEFEVGLGTYIGGTNSLRRDTVLDSSSGGALVNFSTGTKDVFVVYPATRAVVVDGSSVNIPNAATVPITGGGTNASSASEARTNLGFGSVALQDAGNVNVDGGSIDGTSIGSTTPSDGAFTTVYQSGSQALDTTDLASNGGAVTQRDVSERLSKAWETNIDGFTQFSYIRAGTKKWVFGITSTGTFELHDPGTSESFLKLFDNGGVSLFGVPSMGLGTLNAQELYQDGNPVVESGSNSNGHWTRWADGTQICFRTLSASTSTAVTWTFPTQFVNGPNTVVSGSVQSTSTTRVIVHDSQASNTSIELSVRDNSNNRAPNVFRAQATGKWY